MKFTGNIRKMQSELGKEVNYTLPLYDILEPNYVVELNQLVGQKVRITFENAIHCVVSGKKITKTFGDGMSYDAFMTSPLASPSIIRPELSRIHEGIALRDYEWEMAHHMQPHYVYLSNTSGLKVGVTRTTQVPTRWIDQGASQAIVLAETSYRQAAGLIEIALKDYLADKTNWQLMLKGEPVWMDLEKERDYYSNLLPEDLRKWIKTDSVDTLIKYPVLTYPEKVKSLKLDSMPEIEGTLTGIKGQYLMLDYSNVLNLRSHSGYRISMEY